MNAPMTASPRKHNPDRGAAAPRRTRIACSALSIAVFAAFALVGCEQSPYEPEAETPASDAPQVESMPPEEDATQPEAAPPETGTENAYPSPTMPPDETLPPEQAIPEQPVPEPEPTTDDAPPDR